MPGTTVFDRQATLESDIQLRTEHLKLSRARGSSLGAKEAETHVPTLKNQGKSDCSVQIISILDARTKVSHEVVLRAECKAALTEGTDASNRLNGQHDASSRTPQLRRARRRPLLDMKSTDSSAKRHVKRPSLTSAKSFVDGNTIRRLTSGMWCVRKSAFSGAKQDGSRLLKQIEKQILFSTWTKTTQIRTTLSTPEVFGISQAGTRSDGKILEVDMEYVPFNDVKHIMLEKDKFINEWFIDAAIEMVDHNLSASTQAPLSDYLPIFANKAESIVKALSSSVLTSIEEKNSFVHQLDRVLAHYRSRDRYSVPIGLCHGDLTLANMLVDTDNRDLCVFDFLDCFVESPLQDIAKLLQDAKHQWFLTQTPIPSDKRARATTMLDMYHQKIKSAYSGYTFWDLVPLFEFFCLARILPYMTEPQEKSCIFSGINRICAELFAGHLSSPRLNDLTAVFAPSSTADAKTTVIVTALGSAMEAPYAQGQVKLLTLNANGLPLIVDCLSGLDMDNVSQIVIVVLRTTIESRCSSTRAFETMFTALGNDVSSRISFHYAESQTHDAVQSVSEVIQALDIRGSIFVKDADNDFRHTVFSGNYVTYTSLIRAHKSTADFQDDALSNSRPGYEKTFLRPDLVDAFRKSYVTFFYDNVISNVSYSSLLSSDFCCGGWSFLRAEDFLAAANRLRVILRSIECPEGMGDEPVELRVVDVVWQLVCEGHLFFGLKVDRYKDWGSRGAWLATLNAGYSETFRY